MLSPRITGKCGFQVSWQLAPHTSVASLASERAWKSCHFSIKPANPHHVSVMVVSESHFITQGNIALHRFMSPKSDQKQSSQHCRWHPGWTQEKPFSFVSSFLILNLRWLNTKGILFLLCLFHLCPGHLLPLVVILLTFLEPVFPSNFFQLNFPESWSPSYKSLLICQPLFWYLCIWMFLFSNLVHSFLITSHGCVWLVITYHYFFVGFLFVCLFFPLIWQFFQ